MASTGKLVSFIVLLLLSPTALVALVPVPVSLACSFGLVFEFDGCVPSPLLYTWDSSSPTAAEAPPSCIWDMPWGRVSLPCNFMNCQTIVYPDGYTPQSQSVSCSSLTVNIQRLVNNVPTPVKDHTLVVSANLTCTGAKSDGGAFINATIVEKTDSHGTATFLIPSSLENHGSIIPDSTCYTLDWYSTPQGDGLTVRDLNSGTIHANIPWPTQQNSLVVWLPSISTQTTPGHGRGWYVL
jgi:hypothetical protein